jgi:hypothetical protein
MKRQTSGLLYYLSAVSWDWFGTMTFGMRKVPLDQSQPDLLEQGKKFKITGCRVPPVAVRYSMFFQWLRQQERHWQQKKTEWVLRHEKGELGGRPHFHFLIRALPPGANSNPLCGSPRGAGTSPLRTSRRFHAFPRPHRAELALREGTWQPAQARH